MFKDIDLYLVLNVLSLIKTFQSVTVIEASSPADYFSLSTGSKFHQNNHKIRVLGFGKD